MVPDAKFGVLLQKVQDADFCYALPKAVLRKTGKEWERDFVPPYVMSTCFYHTHSEAVGLSCSVKREVEACALASLMLREDGIVYHVQRSGNVSRGADRKSGKA